MNREVICFDACRSREGAWIEMLLTSTAWLMLTCRSREGAWIEIRPRLLRSNERLCRSREGAWIEILCDRDARFWRRLSLP